VQSPGVLKHNNQHHINVANYQNQKIGRKKVFVCHKWNGHDRNLSTSRLDSGSSWLDGVNGILMQQEPDLPKQDYWNRRAIASLANTLITVMELVPTPLLSSMPLLQL
jgi:hypothetical protein